MACADVHGRCLAQSCRWHRRRGHICHPLWTSCSHYTQWQTDEPNVLSPAQTQVGLQNEFQYSKFAQIIYLNIQIAYRLFGSRFFKLMHQNAPAYSFYGRNNWRSWLHWHPRADQTQHVAINSAVTLILHNLTLETIARGTVRMLDSQ